MVSSSSTFLCRHADAVTSVRVSAQASNDRDRVAMPVIQSSWNVTRASLGHRP
jgi:hypothetical protein